MIKGCHPKERLGLVGSGRAGPCRAGSGRVGSGRAGPGGKREAVEWQWGLVRVVGVQHVPSVPFDLRVVYGRMWFNVGS